MKSAKRARLATLPPRRGAALDRRRVVARLVADRSSMVIVAGLGSPSWDLAAAGDHPLNFYLWGAMGGACMTALGLAMAQRHRRIVVIVGDGEMLMGLGSLATIATAHAANLAILVLDNERYGETGNQPTATAAGADLEAIARAAGFAAAMTIRAEDQIDAALRMLRQQAGPTLVVAKVGTEQLPKVLPPRDAGYLKHRLRGALLEGPEPLP